MQVAQIVGGACRSVLVRRGRVRSRLNGRGERNGLRQQIVEGFQPQHLRLEDATEVARGGDADFFDGEGLSATRAPWM